KNCVANFLGRGETNGTILKDLLANSFYCVICLDEGEARKVRIYTIFKAITQSGISALLFIRAKRNERECFAHNFLTERSDRQGSATCGRFLFFIFYFLFFSACLVR
ncbi:MAG: hypothetical protein IJG23_00640, partial [Clostridia bacterium]|nr:hypothetical protein [Clostridia bacterium]